MIEALFYHLDRQPLERVLPILLERTLQRGWTAVVEAGSPERLAALDDHLWSYSEDGFLPHGLASEPDCASNPIILTTGPENPAKAPVRFVVDGARLPEDALSYQRIVLMFDGADEVSLGAARADWKAAKAQGLAATYWQQDENGRWEKKA
jgi:DNA polymerase III subunit chi